jgi:hypothetical protein
MYQKNVVTGTLWACGAGEELCDLSNNAKKRLRKKLEIYTVTRKTSLMLYRIKSFQSSGNDRTYEI